VLTTQQTNHEMTPVPQPKAGAIGRWSLLGLAAVVLLAGAFYAGFSEGPFSEWVVRVIVIAVGGGLLVLLTTVTWKRIDVGPVWVVLVLALALAFRLAALPASRELSDDAARYHWDGKVLAHGINPYRYPPDDPALSHLRTDALDERINHPAYLTCYPPLAQILFSAGYLLTPGQLTGFQMLCLVAELATWLLLWRELRRRGKPMAWLLLAAWCPLIIFQGYLPGHLDVLTLPLVTLFLLHTAAGRPWGAGLTLGLACLIKPLPLIFAPAALRQFGWRGSWRFALAATAITMTLYLPFWQVGGKKLFISSWLMATKWSFNGTLAALLESHLALDWAHLAAAVLALGLILLGTWRGADLFSRMLLAQAAFLVCSPTLFPWYLIGMYPLLVLRPDPALLAIGTLAPLADEVIIKFHTQGLWEPAAWVRPAEFGPFFVLLILGAWHRWGMFSSGKGRQTKPESSLTPGK
jgi:hypothetical protein